VQGVMKQASFLDTVKTVLSAMIGVRRKADHERARLNPKHVVVIAVLFVVLFVLALRTLVRVVVS
jgi:hypothetical protein